jgi:prepilin signal peptidase PulO-like enzyme (type II secretory pathway)
VFGFVWGIAAAFIGAALNETLPFAGLYDSLIGACVGAGAIAIAGWLGEVALKKEAMGFGDVTLMAVVGAALGPQRSLLTVFLGAALGAVSFLLLVYPIAWIQSRRKQEAVDLPLVPFGVFLAPAAMIALFFGQAMIDWYRLDIMGL